MSSVTALNIFRFDRLRVIKICISFPWSVMTACHRLVCLCPAVPVERLIKIRSPSVSLLYRASSGRAIGFPTVGYKRRGLVIRCVVEYSVLDCSVVCSGNPLITK